MKRFVATFQPVTIKHERGFQSMSLSIFDERCRKYEFEARTVKDIPPIMETLGREYISGYRNTFKPEHNGTYGSVRLANRTDRKPNGFDKVCGHGFKIMLEETVAA